MTHHGFDRRAARARAGETVSRRGLDASYTDISSGPGPAATPASGSSNRVGHPEEAGTIGGGLERVVELSVGRHQPAAQDIGQGQVARVAEPRPGAVPAE